MFILLNKAVCFTEVIRKIAFIPRFLIKNDKISFPLNMILLVSSFERLVTQQMIENSFKFKGILLLLDHFKDFQVPSPQSSQTGSSLLMKRILMNSCKVISFSSYKLLKYLVAINRIEK